MPNIISRQDAEALIQEQIVGTISQEAPQHSTFMQLARRLPNMTSRQTRIPVLDMLPMAYWVNGDTGFKQTSMQKWENVFLTAEELAKVSALVNEAVLEGYDVVTEEMPIEEAKKKGAIALFGEKYGEVVRVVDMGEGYSVEFCGGTHLSNTAKVGVFHISNEFSVASGVRRIEATTGKLSLDVMNQNQKMLFEAAAVLKAKPGELREKAKAMMTEAKKLHQEIEKFKAEASVGEARQFLMSAKTVGELKVLTASRENVDAATLRQMGDFLKDKEPNVVAVLASTSGEKISFLAVCGKNAIAKGIKAGDLVKNKPDSAMGGGKDMLKLDDALASVDDYVAVKLGL